MIQNQKLPFSYNMVRISALLLFLLLPSVLYAQPPKYRTFAQDSLALKKAKAGKIIASDVCFKFHNTTDSINNDLHAKFNGHVLAVLDSGGYTSVTINDKGKTLDLSGKDVVPGDSVTICLRVDKKDSNSIASSWWWTKNAAQVGPKNKNLGTINYDPIHVQPNGGNVLEYI